MAKVKLVRDLREMSVTDLTKKIISLEEEYFRLRCGHKTGQLTDKSALRKTRREIAKAKTIFGEREMQKLQKSK